LYYGGIQSRDRGSEIRRDRCISTSDLTGNGCRSRFSVTVHTVWPTVTCGRVETTSDVENLHFRFTRNRKYFSSVEMVADGPILVLQSNRNSGSPIRNLPSTTHLHFHLPGNGYRRTVFGNNRRNVAQSHVWTGVHVVGHQILVLPVYPTLEVLF